ncbi:MAG: CBS domain-containing protein [Methanomicrobiales archaeon]|jgi:predicted transcriptional regulator|nr:CBS domain-containing protein [Methanomicrobiales archaeon]
MHVPTPAEIRARREALGIRQAELARLAGISQSMVARIEAGNVDPRVSTLNKVIEVLERADAWVVTAKDVMHTPVIAVDPNDTVSSAVEIMDRHGISQLPVVEGGVPIGCISESAIISAIEEQRLHRRQDQRVHGLLEPGFPTVPPDIDIETVVRILQNHHAVLVVEGGKVEGVVTKHDLITLLGR